MGFFRATTKITDESAFRNPDAERYERKKVSAAARSRSEAAAGKEIGPIPPPADPERRAACEFDLQLYCETYHGGKFPLMWSPSHLDLIAALQRAVLVGEKRAIGFPRGTGKTTLDETAVEWGTSYGHRRLAVLVASEEGKATDSLEAIKKDLETNDLLLADFPEIVIPIRRLNRTPQKARGQIFEGQPTYIEWGANEIVFASIPGSKASGVHRRRGSDGLSRPRHQAHAAEWRDPAALINWPTRAVPVLPDPPHTSRGRAGQRCRPPVPNLARCSNGGVRRPMPTR